MTTNTSDQSGYLTPVGTPVPYDDALIDLLQPVFVGLSGLTGTAFRPRWQLNDVPNQPEQNENWAALGISRMRTDVFAYQGHVDSGAGYNVLQRTEEIDVLLSFYGPLGKTYAEQTRDGLSIEQNRAALEVLKMGVVSVGDSVLLPALLNGRWQRRVDVTVTLRRCVERQYNILTVTELPDGTHGPTSGLSNEQYITHYLWNHLKV